MNNMIKKLAYYILVYIICYVDPVLQIDMQTPPLKKWPNFLFVPKDVLCSATDAKIIFRFSNIFWFNKIFILSFDDNLFFLEFSETHFDLVTSKIRGLGGQRPLIQKKFQLFFPNFFFSNFFSTKKNLKII